MGSQMDIRTKRAYEQPASDDGARVLVDRLWPRGLTKEKAQIDLWLKEIGPTTELRKWFGHDPDKWERFRGRYETEIKHNGELLEILKRKANEGTLTPDERRAYAVPNQFAFGSELLVAPITTPRDPVTLRGSVRAWLPPGAWIDVFTSTAYDGDRELELHRDSASIPVLLRAGGILPLAAEDDLDATRNPDRLELLVAPGTDGEFTLIEDDGTGTTPDTIPTARTTLVWHQDAGGLTIGAADDPHGILPATRTWTVTFVGTDVSLTIPDAPTNQPIEVDARGGLGLSTPHRSEALFAVLNAAQYGHEAKLAAWETLSSDVPPEAMLAALHAQAMPRALIGAVSELLTAR